MIRPRKHLFSVEREGQQYDTKEDMYRLDMNEYVPFAMEELYECWKEKMTNELISGYPIINRAYNAISRLLDEPIEKIVVTNGSDGVLLSTLQAFCDPGDTIGFVIPTYGMYSVYANMLNLKTICISYNENRELDTERIISAITSELKVFILANPNGITGDDLDYEFIVRLIEKGHETGTVILLDEVYAPFVDNGCSRFIHLTDVYDNLIIARSFSKGYGLAGLRAGYSISHKKTRKFILSVRNNVEINSAAVVAIEVWCEHPELLKECLSNINQSKLWVTEELNGKNFKVINGSGNFVLIHIPDEHIDKFIQKFKQENICVKWLVFGTENWIRVTVGTVTYMNKFVEIMKEEA